MKSFVAAIQFLTTLPFVGKIEVKEEHLARSVMYFPLVGLLMGGLLAGIDFLLLKILPVNIVSLFDLAFLVLLTGGLHLDGIKDTADGFFSSKPREKILEIMKDPRCGSMGAIALFLILLFKYQLFCSIPEMQRSEVLFITPMVGRVAIVAMMLSLSYVRKGYGLVVIFMDKLRRMDILLGVSILFGICFYLFSLYWACSILIGLVVVSFIFSYYVKKKIGGFTGDTLGAICELGELVPSLVVLILTF